MNCRMEPPYSDTLLAVVSVLEYRGCWIMERTQVATEPPQSRNATSITSMRREVDPMHKQGAIHACMKSN